MKKLILPFLFLLFLQLNISSIDLPPIVGYVNDYAGMISKKTELYLEEKLKNLEETDSTQVVIVTLPTLEGHPIEEISIKLAETTGIGQKKKDNGVLFLVAKAERKIRIEVGYGLESKLTDLLAGRIIDHIISPNFRNGDFDKGFIEGTEAIIATVKGEFAADKLKRSNEKDLSFPITFLIITFIFISFIIQKSHFLIKGLIGGILGFSILLIILLFFGIPITLFFLLLLLFFGGGFGAIFMILLALYMTTPYTKKKSYFGNSGSWFSSGSSGGFSGGGGSFGGGGASGGW